MIGEDTQIICLMTSAQDSFSNFPGNLLDDLRSKISDDLLGHSEEKSKPFKYSKSWHFEARYTTIQISLLEVTTYRYTRAFEEGDIIQQKLRSGTWSNSERRSLSAIIQALWKPVSRVLQYLALGNFINIFGLKIQQSHFNPSVNQHINHDGYTEEGRLFLYLKLS